VHKLTIMLQDRRLVKRASCRDMSEALLQCGNSSRFAD